MSGATTKLECWRPQGIPLDEPEKQAIRQLAVEAVFAVWNQHHRPAHLSEIYLHVKQKIGSKKAKQEWSYPIRSKRTIDRRVNEAASALYGFPKIVAVSAGIYEPNPLLFKEVKE